MIDKNYYLMPHDPKRELPETDDRGDSDMCVVQTSDGQCETARYNRNTKLWYSSSDPTGFGNVVSWSAFVMNYKVKFDESLYYDVD